MQTQDYDLIEDIMIGDWTVDKVKVKVLLIQLNPKKWPISETI